jgi:hypothetical protein
LSANRHHTPVSCQSAFARTCPTLPKFHAPQSAAGHREPKSKENADDADEVRKAPLSARRNSMNPGERRAILIGVICVICGVLAFLSQTPTSKSTSRNIPNRVLQQAKAALQHANPRQAARVHAFALALACWSTPYTRFCREWDREHCSIFPEQPFRCSTSEVPLWRHPTGCGRTARLSPALPRRAPQGQPRPSTGQAGPWRSAARRCCWPPAES